MSANQKKSIKKEYDKKRNRFMRLRYNSDTDKYADINANDLAKEFGCSKATISSMENTDNDENTLLGKSARLYKGYHDYFGCSYEYLFGECPLPDPKYIGLGNSPLASLEKQTLDNLEKMLSDKEFGTFNDYMIKALMSEPKALQTILNIIFRFMYLINQINGDKSLNSAEKTLASSDYWISLNANLDNYLKDTLLPHLQVGFEMFEEKEKEREEEKIKRIEEDYKKYVDEMSAPIIGKLIEPTDESQKKDKS